MRVCIKCSFTGDEALFQKKTNICKKCASEYNKTWKKAHPEYNNAYRKNNPEKVAQINKKWAENNPEKVRENYDIEKEKTCSKCGFKGKGFEFTKEKNICRMCTNQKARENREKNPEKERERDKNRRKANPEKFRDSDKKRYQENPEIKKGRSREYREKFPEEIKERDRKRYQENPELKKSSVQKYSKTPKGRVCDHRHAAKRRSLGHDPINSWFKGSDAHHFRYGKSHDERDNNITIYAPRELHRSIIHNGNTGNNMREINVLLIEWYLNATPEEELNSKAVELYWNYCVLPAPKWEMKKDEQ